MLIGSFQTIVEYSVTPAITDCVWSRVVIIELLRKCCNSSSTMVMIPAAAVDVSIGSQSILTLSLVTITTPQCTYELNRSDFVQKEQLFEIYDNINRLLLQGDDI